MDIATAPLFLDIYVMFHFYCYTFWIWSLCYYYFSYKIISLGYIPRSGITRSENFKDFARHFKDLEKTPQIFPTLLVLDMTSVSYWCKWIITHLPNFYQTLCYGNLPKATLPHESRGSDYSPKPPLRISPVWSPSEPQFWRRVAQSLCFLHVAQSAEAVGLWVGMKSCWKTTPPLSTYF